MSFAGLVGSKRTDVMRAIFGADPYTSGEVYIKGKRAEIKSPKDALQYSLGLIPENRKTQGFVKNFTNASNMALASMNRFCSRGFVNARKIYDNCMYYTGEMNLHPADLSDREFERRKCPESHHREVDDHGRRYHYI